jgi:membrane-bound lytic murein transglycosylase D
MMPKTNNGKLLRGYRERTSLGSGLSWVGLLVVLLLGILSYSKLEASTEPRMETETTDSDSVLGTSRALTGDVLNSPVSSVPKWGYLNYSRDFPLPMESPQLPVPEHPSVVKYVHYFQGQGRETFFSAIRSSWVHVPLMMEILKSYEVPAELVYMVLVESRFKNNAVSPQGAAGCWQLMPATARRLGLRVDKYVDERYDAVKSTHAAGRYLKSFYDTLHSWPLAIAAYNVGIRPVLKVVHKKRGEDVWAASGSGGLPGMTFASKVFAAIVIARDLEGFGFERPRLIPLDGSDFVWVHSALSLQQVARWVGTTLEEVRALNPSLRSDHLPSGDEAFCLRLPSKTSPRFKVAYQQFLMAASDG